MSETGILISDGSQVFDLLNPPGNLKDKFLNQNVMGLRVHGLLGDIIKSTCTLSSLIAEDPSRKYVFLISYNDVTKKDLAKDLLSDLTAMGMVVGLFLNENSNIGNMSYAQFSFLKEIGCSEVKDLYYFSQESYQKLGIAYLGFPNPSPNSNKIALFRFSGFHKHVARRHIPEQEWLLLEEYLIELGFDVHLYGHTDDTMQTLVTSENDHRGKLGVLETIKHSANSGLCISTTTFLPHYLHHFIPCLVFADPSDLALLSLKWRTSHKFMVVDTTLSDHLEFIKDYVSMHYRANLNTKAVMGNITEFFKTQEIKGV